MKWNIVEINECFIFCYVCINVSYSELFTTVLDMLSVLINSTLNSDGGGSPGSGEEKGRQHQTLIKKLKVCTVNKYAEAIGAPQGSGLGPFSDIYNSELF